MVSRSTSASELNLSARKVRDAVGARLEGNEPGSCAPVTPDRLHERFLLHHPEPGVALELLELFDGERFPHCYIGRVRDHDIPALFQFIGPLHRLELYLSPDVLRTLPPLEFDAGDPQLFYGIFRRTQTRILHILLKNDITVSVMPLLEALDPALQLGRTEDHTVLDVGVRIHARDVLSDHHHDA